MSTPLDLGITTSCHGYGRYLEEWAEGILDLTVRPANVGIFTHGPSGGEDDLRGLIASRMLMDAGIPTEWRHWPEKLDFGTARNMAVELVHNEWVMHLDADDVIMPHALEDISKLAPQADIVALGYERSGDLAAGPRQKVKLYKSSAGQALLDNPTPASGVSPFRRAFWERTPYRTDMHGGWDTALWIGFAKLGARCVATSRPCFWYRQHADSIFNTRRLSGWPAARTGAKLQSLRRGDTGVAIIVPRTPGDPARDQAWEWLRRRYQRLYPEWQILEGIGDRRQWRKGDAIRNAVSRCKAATLILSDADCVLPEEALLEAVELVRTGAAPWVVPHDVVHRLTEPATAAWLAQEEMVVPPATDLIRAPYQGFAGGGMVVVGRADLDATGGIPSSFVGWGAEDEALAVILDTLVGQHQRLPHPLVHLWHPPQETGVRNRGLTQKSNRRTFIHFAQAKGNPEAVWSLVQSGTPHHSSPYAESAARHQTLLRRHTTVRNQAVMVSRDRFAEMRLAAAQPRQGVKMAGALELRRAAMISRAQQAKRNEEATKARKAPAEDKARRAPEEDTARRPDDCGDETKEPEIRFASYHAKNLWNTYGLKWPAGLPCPDRPLKLEEVQKLVATLTVPTEGAATETEAEPA